MEKKIYIALVIMIIISLILHARANHEYKDVPVFAKTTKML